MDESFFYSVSLFIMEDLDIDQDNSVFDILGKFFIFIFCYFLLYSKIQLQFGLIKIIFNRFILKLY